MQRMLDFVLISVLVHRALDHKKGSTLLQSTSSTMFANRSIVLAALILATVQACPYGILNRKFPKHKNFPKRDATTPHR
jgi:hypothetical protein